MQILTNNYFLLVIDSIAVAGGCPSEYPMCCDAHWIERVYGKIILQTNGLPQFDQPVTVVRKNRNPFRVKSPSDNSGVFDLQGRLLGNAYTINGIRVFNNGKYLPSRIIPRCKK